MANQAKALDYGTTTGVGGVLFTDRRQFYLDPYTYAELWPSMTPFLTGIISEGGVRSGLQDPLFKMFEYAAPFDKQEFVNNASTSSVPNDDTGLAFDVDGIVGLSATCDNSWLGLECEVWDTTRTTKKGHCVVTGITDADTITVKNLTATAFTLADNDIFVVVGHAWGEGMEAPEGWVDELSVVWNATQIMRVSVEVTGTLYEAALRGASKELERLRKVKMQQHKVLTNKVLLRGTSMLGTNMDAGGTFADNWRTMTYDSASRKVRTTMGVIPALDAYGTTSGEYQNVFDYTGGMTWNDFVDVTEKVWQYIPESGLRDFHCGPKAFSFWSKLGQDSRLRSGWEIKISDMKTDKLGIMFKYLETPFGLARLIYEPALKREYPGYMLGLAKEDVFMATYRSLRYRTNIKTDNGYDGIKDEYFLDAGVGIRNIKHHCLIKLPVQ